MSFTATSITRSLSLSLLLVAAAPHPGLAAGSGERLLLFAYGDTRPNFWPFGGQKKHRTITEAMVALDEAEGSEVDGVLVSGDYIFADVPLTDKDWKPAWEAMEVLSQAAHPLPVRPVQGNHELHAVKGLDDDDPDAPLARAILQWGSGILPRSHGTGFDPVVLAGLMRLADPRALAVMADLELIPADMAKDLSAARMGELEDQLEDEMVERLTPSDRDRLSRWRRKIDHLIDILRRSHPRSTAPGELMERTAAHLRALYKLARRGNKGAAPEWLEHTRLAGDGGIGKSWRLFTDRLIRRFGPSMVAGTSLEGVDPGASTGPSWYRFDHPIPGSSRSLRVIGLNTNLSHVAGRGGDHDPLAFLVSAVKEHDGPILLFGHHPVVTAGHHGESWERSEETLIAETRRMIFVTLRAKVSPAEFDRIWAFIAGHDHDYERFVDQDAGRVFMVAGGGGVPLRNRGVPEADIPRMLRATGSKMGAKFDPRAVWRKAYHFVAVEVGPGSMSLKVYGLVEPLDDPLTDEELADRLTPAVLAQREDPSTLVDHLILRQRPGAPGRDVEVVGRRSALRYAEN